MQINDTGDIPSLECNAEVLKKKAGCSCVYTLVLMVLEAQIMIYKGNFALGTNGF